MKDFPEKIWLELYFSLSLQRQIISAVTEDAAAKAVFFVPTSKYKRAQALDIKPTAPSGVGDNPSEASH